MLESQQKYEKQRTEDFSPNFDTPESDEPRKRITLRSGQPTNFDDFDMVRRTTLATRKELKNDAEREEIRHSINGDEMHIVPFKKKDLEKTSGIDHIPEEDNMSEYRHTKEYQETKEKENASKYIPLEKLNTISEPLTAKIRKKTLIRSNSDKLKLASQNSQKTEDNKRRNSINKKYKKNEDGLIDTEITIKGSSSIININPVIDTPEKEDTSFDSDTSSEEDKELGFDRNKRPSDIQIEGFTPKKAIEHNNFGEADKTIEKRVKGDDYMMINNEKRNINLERELEQPHRPSSALRYRKQISQNELNEVKDEDTKQYEHKNQFVSKKEDEKDDAKKEKNNEESQNNCDKDHITQFQTIKTEQGLDLLIDPDEDPEIAAQIDAELANSHVPCPESVKPDPPYLPALPPGREYTLVLDLDETLIHYRDDEEYYLVRPGVPQFLRELSELYDIVLFTAGVKKYADWIVDHIDPQRHITHRLYRRHTVFKDAMYIKDLAMLGRDLRKTLIIDNLYESFLSQPDNGILVKSWYDDMEDTELLTLLPFLRGLVEDQVPDIREVLRRIMNSTSDDEAEGEVELEDQSNTLHPE